MRRLLWLAFLLPMTVLAQPTVESNAGGINTLDDRVTFNENNIFDHDTRITDLENAGSGETAPRITLVLADGVTTQEFRLDEIKNFDLSSGVVTRFTSGNVLIDSNQFWPASPTFREVVEGTWNLFNMLNNGALNGIDIQMILDNTPTPNPADQTLPPELYDVVTTLIENTPLLFYPEFFKTSSIEVITGQMSFWSSKHCKYITWQPSSQLVCRVTPGFIGSNRLSGSVDDGELHIKSVQANHWEGRRQLLEFSQLP